MGRVAWNDNSHEGKIIRRLVDRLNSKVNKTEDVDEMIKILNAISNAANTKTNIAKYEKMDDKLNSVLKLLKEFKDSKQFTKFVEDNYVNQLPG